MEELHPQEWLGVLYACALFLIGLAIGSFLNVIIYRLPLGMSLFAPPSSCPLCSSRIPARYNIPLLGWLLLGGKCHVCRHPISIRYPAVELATGLLWAIEGWRLAGDRFGFWPNVLIGVLELAFLSSLVVTFLVDWDYQIILDEVSLGGLAVSLATAPLLPALHRVDPPELFSKFHPFLASFFLSWPLWGSSFAVSAIGALAGFFISLALYFLGTALCKRKIEEMRQLDPEIDSALGLGDVKLMAFYGAFLGWQGVVGVLLIASVLCSLVGSARKLLSGQSGGAGGWTGLANRWRSGVSIVPFGPFLALGALACLFGEWQYRVF
ncbi:MAG: prepilin peptidase [Planctomycetota bacterium]|nr:prepilin peptidase [Planctomycetota bacterium]